ncbi:hypothetical protein VTI74DRAFT_6521 [Chaetomium olivicolor]
MPFGEDLFGAGSMSPLPLVQSDLLGSPAPETPTNQVSVEVEATGLTVVTLDDRAGLREEAAGVPEADMHIEMGDEAEANSVLSAPSSTIKKRGRPSLSATPAKSVGAKTPRSTKSTATPKSTGRSTGKRKSAESEPREENEAEATPAPAPKRGRPARSAGAAASARLAAKAAKKPARGRPKGSASAAKPAKKARRTKKEVKDEDEEMPEGEYEVEDIVDSAIDADTLEHMYLVKWKNYPASENTWEPKKNLRGSLELVRKADARKKKEEAEKAAKMVSARKKAAVAPTGAEKKATRRRKPKAVKAIKAAKKAPGRPGRKRSARV